MKTKNLLYSLCLCCSLQFSHAQLSPKVIAPFPAHIVATLHDLNTKINLTEDKLLKVGQRLVTNDSLANVQKSTLSPDKLKQYYTLNKQLLQGIVENIELDNFLYQEDTDNRFLLALAKAPELRLNSSQTVAIRKQIELLENSNNKKPNDLIPYYRKKLDSILDQKQIAYLLKQVYAIETKIQTDKEWKAINDLEILGNKDPKLAYNELLNYNTNLNIFLDERGQKFEQKRMTELKSKFILKKQPLVLMHKKILANLQYQNSHFALALMNQKLLELTPVQVDSLLSKCKKLEMMKNSNLVSQSVGVTPFIYENLPIILTPKQLALVLNKRHEKEAQDFAVESWKQIEALNWTAGVDKSTTIRDFRLYKLRSLVANEKLKLDKNQANLFMRRDVETKKPELLKKLDELKAAETNTKSTKNALKW